MINKVFTSLYDKAGIKCEQDDMWTIVELDKNSGFTQLTVMCPNSHFVSFSQCLTKNMPNTTSERSTFLKDKECDGIAFLEIGKSEKLLFTELKTKCDTQRVKSAILQMFSSFLKMYQMLSLCKGFEITQLPICFYVGTKGAAESEESEILEMLDKGLMVEEYKDEMIILKKLFEGDVVRLDMKKIVQEEELQLHLNEDILSLEVEVRWFRPANSIDSSCIVSL